jgi:hypothetical protein
MYYKALGINIFRNIIYNVAIVPSCSARYLHIFIFIFLECIRIRTLTQDKTQKITKEQKIPMHSVFHASELRELAVFGRSNAGVIVRGKTRRSDVFGTYPEIVHNTPFGRSKSFLFFKKRQYVSINIVVTIYKLTTVVTGTRIRSISIALIGIFPGREVARVVLIRVLRSLNTLWWYYCPCTVYGSDAQPGWHGRSVGVTGKSPREKEKIRK